MNAVSSDEAPGGMRRKTLCWGCGGPTTPTYGRRGSPDPGLQRRNSIHATASRPHGTFADECVRERFYAQLSSLKSSEVPSVFVYQGQRCP